MSSAIASGALAAALLLASPPALPPLDQVVARYLEAQGGAARLRALKSVRESGTATMNMAGETAEGVYLLEAKRPNRMRVELTFGDTQIVDLFDGTSGWSLDDESGTYKRMSKEETREQEVASEFDDWLLDYRERGVTVEDLGLANVGSTATRKLKLTFKGESEHVYIDARSYLEVRRDTLDKRGLPTEQMRSLLFTTVNGLTFAEVVEITTSDPPSHMTLRAVKTELDAAIPNARFAPPK